MLTIVKILIDFNSKTRNSVKFGMNTCVNLIQKEDDGNKLILVFMFYDENVKTLLDLLLLKCKDRTNVKLYLLDKGYK